MSRRNDERSGSIQVGNRRWRIAAVATATLAIAALAAPAATGQATYTQRFTLRPGWNAIFLEVQPEPSEVAAVFATGCVSGCNPAGGVPLASVWTYDARFGGKVDDIVDPARGLIDTTGWYGFFPSGRAEAVLTNLFHLRVNRAYLVKIDGTTPATWTVTGRPSLRRQKWEADSFNLVGFPVAPDNPPSFGSWFEPSAAHRGQPIYRLDPVGIWQPVLPYFEPISSGQAYWVWTRGVSAYQGPLEVELELSDGLEFDVGGEQSTLTIRNLRDLGTTVGVMALPAVAPVAVKYQALDNQTGQRVWEPLPAPLAVPVPGETMALLTLAPSRADFVADQVAQVLEISDGLGYRRLIPVSAATVEAQPGGASSRSPAPHAFAGLWVGSATVDRVGEARCAPEPRSGCECLPDGSDTTPDPRDLLECRADLDNNGEFEVDCAADEFCRCLPPTCVQTVPTDLVTPTGSSFELRLIVFVDAAGQPTLLKEVIQLVDPPGMIPSPVDPEFLTVDPDNPARTVLITDDALIPQFEGGVMRDGAAVGVRIATAAYDFDDQAADAGTRGLTMSGEFGATAALAVEVGTDPSLPTHPFKHKYHPDHGDDAPPASTITRNIQLLLRNNWGWCDESLSVPCSVNGECGVGGLCRTDFLQGLIAAPPGWGADTVGGTYREEITGLHRQTLTVEGAVVLSRAARTTTINPTTAN